jgi:hypothetical protein
MGSDFIFSQLVKNKTDACFYLWIAYNARPVLALTQAGTRYKQLQH